MTTNFRTFFILCSFSLYYVTHAQSITVTPSNQETTKKINQLSFDNQLSLLFWFNKQPKGVYGGGIVTQKLNTLQNSHSKYTATILNVYEGVAATNASKIPFPSRAIRGSGLTKTAFSFAKNIYRSSYVIDIPSQQNIAFYGIKLSNNMVTLTPYTTNDSLWNALHEYDQIWWQADFNSLKKQLFNSKKISKKTKKWVGDKVFKVLGLKNQQTSNLSLTSTDDYIRWAWNTYSKGIMLLNNPSKLPITLLDTTYFAIATLDNVNFSTCIRHLNFYTQHAFYPRAIDFNWDYNEGRLSKYGYVMVPTQYIGQKQVERINKLAHHTQVVVLYFSDRPPPNNLSKKVTLIQAPQLNGVTQALVPQLIFGALGFNAIETTPNYAPLTIATKPLGRLQFGPPELVYMDARVLHHIDTLMQNGIRQQATPGSQILVAKNGIVVYYQNFGFKTYKNQAAIKENNLYDLASLTKVMATTQAIMFLTERGFLDIDLPISHYLPEMQHTDKAFIPVREILAHQAGLYPYIPFWKQVLPKRDLENAFSHTQVKNRLKIGKNDYIAPYLQDSLLSWAIHSKKIRKNNSEQPYGYRYSDIGFIILKTLVERIVNQPIDEFLDQNLYAPMGMTRTTFKPLCKFPASDIVPTEGNGSFRIGELTGYVNDPNAALIGGVSGHAGLFSTALDLGKLMQMQLQLGTYGGTRYFYPETILTFSKRHYVGNRRGLGWDKPSVGPNGPTTLLASQKTFGHTGFTGTAAWADPDHQLIFIFLSNRVYPDAGNFKLNQLNIRTRIQGLLYEAIDFNK